MQFIEGRIEHLDEAGMLDQTVDIIISNCVVNLSPDKLRVLNEAYRVLAPGGEFYFSDVYCDRRLPDAVRQHKVSNLRRSALLLHLCASSLPILLSDFTQQAAEVHAMCISGRSGCKSWPL